MFDILRLLSFKDDCSSLETQSTHFLEDSTIVIPSKSTMVNTRKGNYQTHSSKAVDEALVSQTNMRMRGRLFKSTPTRRPYHLPSKKIQVNICKSSPLSMHVENVAHSAAESVETAPNVFESHISEMDSDGRDDVPLARLLRKGLLSNVEPSRTVDPVTSVHSHASSSYEEIIIPTLGDPPMLNKEACQSGRSPPVRSLIWVDPLVDDQHSVPDSDPVGESIENLGGNFASLANQNPTDVDVHVKPTDTCAPDNVEPDVNVIINTSLGM
ncbi:uncharacterized protein E5676_scaffold232G00330 [Cucumis melo var. makuwa]|uniref:Envelope-like protein n=1 Tax=Cucumis melo var. makuwa TaxID=1194695 RepID=A0A5D3BIS0_CUCMM|nr:uncharacterized protein E5676_scaffold232G00330 [Cucumis melo var. makuwa]